MYNRRDSTVKVSEGTYWLAVLCASLGLCLKYRHSNLIAAKHILSPDVKGDYHVSELTAGGAKI